MTPSPDKTDLAEAIERLGLSSPTWSDADVERVARAIFQHWAFNPQGHPWVKGGNSDKQDDARRLARAALEAAGAPHVQAAGEDAQPYKDALHDLVMCRAEGANAYADTLEGE